MLNRRIAGSRRQREQGGMMGVLCPKPALPRISVVRPCSSAAQRGAERLTRILDACAEPGRAVLVSVEADDALLQLAFRLSPSGDEEIVAETREMLHAYLARMLD
jgi:hypothetical protein